MVRPEIEGALSDGSMRYVEGEIRVTEDSSSHISPVKQEAAKAAIKDMVKGSPALETRRMRDQCHFNEEARISGTNFLDCKSSKVESVRTG